MLTFSDLYDKLADEYSVAVGIRFCDVMKIGREWAIQKIELQTAGDHVI